MGAQKETHTAGQVCFTSIATYSCSQNRFMWIDRFASKCEYAIVRLFIYFGRHGSIVSRVSVRVSLCSGKICAATLTALPNVPMFRTASKVLINLSPRRCFTAQPFVSFNRQEILFCHFCSIQSERQLVLPFARFDWEMISFCLRCERCNHISPDSLPNRLFFLCFRWGTTGAPSLRQRAHAPVHLCAEQGGARIDRQEEGSQALRYLR